MLFTAPAQFIVLAIILIAGYLLGLASRPGTRKLRAKIRDQAESFTAYHDDAEDRIRAATGRATALEAEAAALRADHAEAERTITALRAVPTPVIAEAPVVAPIEAAPASRPALALVETPAVVAAEPVAETITEPEPVVDATPAPATVEPVTEEPVATAAPVEADTAPEPAAAVEPLVAAAPLALVASHPAVDDDPAPVEPVAEVHEVPPADAPMTPTPTDAEPAPIGAAEPAIPARGWLASSVRDDLTRIRGIDATLNTRLFSLGVLRFEDLEKLSAEDEMALEERLALPVGTVARDQWRAQAALLRAGNEREHAERFGTEAVPAEA